MCVLGTREFYDLQAHKVERKKEAILLRWTPLAEGWMKLNSVGATDGETGRVRSGFILFDSCGKWI